MEYPTVTRLSRLRSATLASLGLVLAAGCVAESPDVASVEAPTGVEATGTAAQAVTGSAQAMVLIDSRLYQALKPLVDQYVSRAETRRGFPIQVNSVDHLDDYPYYAVHDYIVQQRTTNPSIRGVLFMGNIKLPTFYKVRADIPENRIYPNYYQDLDAQFSKFYADGATDPVCDGTTPNCVVGSPFTVPAHDFDGIAKGANPDPEIWAAFMPVGVTGTLNLYTDFAAQLTPYLQKVISFYEGQLPSNGRYYFVSNDRGETFDGTWSAFGPNQIDFYGRPGPNGETGQACITSSGQNLCYTRWPTETYGSYAAFASAYAATPWVDEGWQAASIFMNDMNASRYDVAEVNVHSNEVWSLLDPTQAASLTKGGLIVALDGCSVAGFGQPYSPSKPDDSTWLPSDTIPFGFLYGKSSALAVVGDPFARAHTSYLSAMYQDMKLNHDYLGAAHLVRMKALYAAADAGADLKDQAAEALFGDPFMDLNTAAAPPPPPPPPATVTASVAVTSTWVANGQRSYCANVTISNDGPNTITTWGIGLNAPDATIYNSWSAAFSGAAPAITLAPFSYNGTLPPQNNLTFGYCANVTGTEWTPTISSVTGH